MPALSMKPFPSAALLIFGIPTTSEHSRTSAASFDVLENDQVKKHLQPQPLHHEQQEQEQHEQQEESKPKKSVTFAPEVRVTTTLCLQDFTVDEIANTWYSKEEFDVFRQVRKQLVKQYEHGLFADEDNDSTNFTIRGLEHRTREGARRRKYNIIESVYAVLEEQDRQDELGCSSSSEQQLAILYSQHTRHCTFQAQQLGRQDEDWVQSQQQQARTA